MRHCSLLQQKKRPRPPLFGHVPPLFGHVARPPLFVHVPCRAYLGEVVLAHVPDQAVDHGAVPLLTVAAHAFAQGHLHVQPAAHLQQKRATNMTHEQSLRAASPSHTNARARTHPKQCCPGKPHHAGSMHTCRQAGRQAGPQVSAGMQAGVCQPVCHDPYLERPVAPHHDR